MEEICDQSKRVMLAILWIVLSYPFLLFRPRHDLALEVLALRHQLMVLKRQTGRPKLRPSDRYLWMLLMRVWPNWRNPLMIVQPETLIGWQRAGFRRESQCSVDILSAPTRPYTLERLNFSAPISFLPPTGIQTRERLGGLLKFYYRQAA